MTMATMERQAKPKISVRVTPATKAKLQELVTVTGLEQADLLRLALIRGMVGIGDAVKASPMTKDEFTKLIAPTGARQKA